MTIKEKREFIEAYCDEHVCTRCAVNTIAQARGEVSKNGLPECWGSRSLSEEMLDARIEAIQAEQGSVGTPVEEFVNREDKIAALNEHCDGTTCSDCPCHIDSLKKYCVDGYTCDFNEMSDEGLDAYLKVIGAAREKDLDAARSLKIRRLNDLCSDQAEVCPECPCRELAKEAGTATLCCFEDMDDAMLDRYLAKFSDAATLSETATLSGGGCSGHKVAPPTETSLKDAIHPHHYKLPGGMQVIDVEVAMFGREAVMHHCLCTAAEYILRSRQKNGVEDIKKAHWWLCKYIELEAESK